jgi:hypothetical protein
MMNQQIRFKELLDKYSGNAISESEFTELCELLKVPEYEAEIKNILTEGLPGCEADMQDQDQLDHMLKKVLSVIRTGEKSSVVDPYHNKPVSNLLNVKRIWYKLSAVAAVLLIAGSVWFFLGKHSTVALEDLSKRYKNDVAPGHSGAVLTLSNGQSIILDSAENGLVTKDGDDAVVKNEDGILYTTVKEGQLTVPLYNTVSTDKGRQWHLTLPDGTKAWLNAASSIHFPLRFTGNERVVEISGEVYFEVVHNSKQPFKVKAGNQLIEDIGTRFNVNAYPDEATITTTLLEGSVSVKSATVNKLPGTILSPGQQSQFNNEGNLKLLYNANVEAALAWKDGLFRFEDADIKTIMRQLSRWYAVDVVYEGNIPAFPFMAKIPRDVPVSELLKLLELTNLVHFKIEGKTVTVMK